MAPTQDTMSIGIIGMGEMGRMYAKFLSDGGKRRVHVCDLPEAYEKLQAEYKDVPGITVHKNGHFVSRLSDFIIYSVEAAYIDRIVAEYGPSTKLGAVVAGQTSVKAPEKDAFEKYLPEDVSIISLHSLHGPSISPVGQALIIIQHKGTDEELDMVHEVVKPLKSRIVHMTYEEHDEITANTQAVTHAAFLSMGTAWHSVGTFPWESGRYVRGIEVAKINITLRIYSSKWHVYAGLAILNPVARVQINQYAKSVSDIFKLMIAEKEDELRQRMLAAREFVFPEKVSEVGPDGKEREKARPLFMEDEVFDQFAIGSPEASTSAAPSASAAAVNGSGPSLANASTPPNSHLSLLAMVDSWHQLRLSPFEHLALAATPIFRMWFGVAEYLFRSPERLEAAIKAAVREKSHRLDDAEFMVAARGWSQCVSFGDFEAYRRRFEETAAWFKPRFSESTPRGAMMLKALIKD